MSTIKNHHAEQIETQNHIRLGTTTAGIVLIVASLAGIFGMLHHPTTHSHSFREFIDDVESVNTVNVAVHSAMIVVILLFLFSISWLATVLGLNRSAVRAALIAYSIGAIAFVIAASVSGFLVPNFVSQYSGASTEEINVAAGIGRLLHQVNRTADLFGVVSLSTAVLLFSFAMCSGETKWPVAAIMGFLAGAAGVAGVVTGHIEATVHGTLAFVLLQSVWNVVVGANLIRVK